MHGTNKAANKGSFTPLSSIVEITGNLLVKNLDKIVANLGQILPNLAVIRANPHYRHFKINSGLSITNNLFLKSITLTKLTHILGNNTQSLFLENKRLQYIDTIDWKAIFHRSENVQPYSQDNAGGTEDCPAECENRCWNKATCQKRRKLPIMSVKRDCMHACMHAIYDFVASLVTHIVRQDCWAVDSDGNCTCHDECLSSCNGTTDQNCLSCRHYYYQGRCVSRCPNGTAIVRCNSIIIIFNSKRLSLSACWLEVCRCMS